MTNHETVASFRARAASWIDRHLPSGETIMLTVGSCNASCSSTGSLA